MALSFPSDRAARLASLRSQIARLEGGRHARVRDAVPLAPGLDAVLPAGGLARGAVHEVLAEDDGAAAGFAALMLARAAGPVLWISPAPDAYPPGLAQLGLKPAGLVLVRARAGDDVLWALEEALRAPEVAGAVAFAERLDLTVSRRLQLAAEAGGGLGLVLRPDAKQVPPTACLTRWRVGARPGQGGSRHVMGDPVWRLDLLKSRGGVTGGWDVALRAGGGLEVMAVSRRPHPDPLPRAGEGQCEGPLRAAG